MPPASDDTQVSVTHADVRVPLRPLGDVSVPFDTLKYIPEESAKHYRIVPLSVVDGVLEVGMVDPDDLQAIDALNFITRATGMPFKVSRISDPDFDKVLGMYRGLTGEVDEAVSDLETERGKEKPATLGEEDLAPLDLETTTASQAGNDAAMPGAGTIQEDAPTVKIVSTILRYAIDGKASDIHIEPTGNGVRVRYRVDGELHTSVVLPLKTHRALIARIKVLSSIRLDEQRKPQDGRFSATIDGRAVDFRVSTFPSYYGEKVVMRILDRDAGFIPLKDMGLSERNLDTIRRAVQKPHGLILISGPTGSGKSTTLYSMLGELDREHKNVLSLEDPIEYFIDGITQSQMRPEIGYTFASGLRTTLRQDPDVIMVGEIRDSETAKLAIQAALTGHLVLSTIHTNDAVGTIPRLIDMGVEPYLIPPVLILSIAQRLVRKLCTDAGVPTPLSASDRKAIEAQIETLPEQYRFQIPDTVYQAGRSPTCPTGMRGRAAVFEVLEMSPEIEKVVLENPVDSKIWSVARTTQGMLSMREDAMLKAFAKMIPYDEVTALGDVALATDEPEETAPAAGASTPVKGVKEAKEEMTEL